MRNVLKNTVGDTIVEVMIALAILAAVLGGAYVSANHSVRGVQDAQERTEAVKVAEDQLETMKAAYIRSGETAFSTVSGTYFCMVSDPTDPTGFSVKNLAGSDNTIFTTPNPYPPECVHNALTSGNGISYYISVSSDPTTKIYTIHTRWESILHDNCSAANLSECQSEVTMAYRF